jgi:hypothetical protein
VIAPLLSGGEKSDHANKNTNNVTSTSHVEIAMTTTDAFEANN